MESQPDLGNLQIWADGIRPWSFRLAMENASLLENPIIPDRTIGLYLDMIVSLGNDSELYIQTPCLGLGLRMSHPPGFPFGG